jgi:hypothetical protein
LQLDQEGHWGNPLSLGSYPIRNFVLLFTSENWILKKFRHIESGHIFHLINVYSPVRYPEKVGFWNSLQTFKEEYSLDNCIIGGDFNTTISNEEKKGGNIVRDPMGGKMIDLINDWDLIDIKSVNGKYTWSNKRLGAGHIAARLDHFGSQSFFSSRFPHFL